MKFKIVGTIKQENCETGEIQEGLLLENLGVVNLTNLEVIKGRVVDKFLNIEIVNGKLILSITEN